MEESVWSELNKSWHHHFETPDSRFEVNQPPYLDQAVALVLLSRSGMVNLSNSLDFAAGYARLASLLEKYFDRRVNAYDKYVQRSETDVAYVSESELFSYDLIINSAMFEHVVERESLDRIEELVADDGVLMLHTVICENIPNDPDWFYFEPMVHTAFHTNRSMEILMKQWGYSASVYCLPAKSWFLFKRDHPAIAELEATVAVLNREINSEAFFYSPGFVDYWKGF
jgi:hypothetical protein